MHTKPKSPVRLSKETDPTMARRVDPTNMYRKENVNVAQGPRTGNSSAHGGKRADFIEAKESRAPVADVIAAAYGERQRSDYAGKNFKNDGSIMPDVKPKRFAR